MSVVSDASEEEVRISVILCSHNGERRLPVALESLRRQSLDQRSFEVIVVDDGSVDETSEVARSFGARVVRLEVNQGTAGARNAGVEAAIAEIVAFIDDDCEADPSWAQEMLRPFQEDAVVGAGGRVAPESARAFVRRYLRANNPLEPLGVELLESHNLGYRLLLYVMREALGNHPSDEIYACAGANMALRRSAILEVGGFDEEIRFSPEDEDLCRRLHQRRGGALLRYVPAAVVVHHFDERVRDIFRRSRSYGNGTARLVRKYDEVHPIVFPVPCATIAALAFSLLARRKRVGGASALLPLAGYPRWAGEAVRQRSLEPVLYPYVKALAELATMVGEWDGLCGRA